MKKLWDKLAKSNSKYYINSDFGRGITEEQFMESGLKDYKDLIWDDIRLMNRFVCNGSIVVDLGCGIGRITQFMADDFDQVYGVDISGEMIKQAKKRLKGCKNVGLVETDGWTIPLADNSIDLVFSYLVFQHFKNRKMVEANFKEVYRILKPKGMFKVRIRTDEVDKDRWWGGVEYTEQSIGKLIKKVGFDLQKSEAVGDYGIWLWLEK